MKQAKMDLRLCTTKSITVVAYCIHKKNTIADKIYNGDSLFKNNII